MLSLTNELKGAIEVFGCILLAVWILWSLRVRTHEDRT